MLIASSASHAAAGILQCARRGFAAQWPTLHHPILFRAIGVSGNEMTRWRVSSGRLVRGWLEAVHNPGQGPETSPQ